MKNILILFLILLNLNIPNKIFADNPCFNADEIKKIRKENEDYYKNNEKSPLLEKDKRKFKGLNYYKINPIFALEAKFIKNAKKDTLIMKTSKNDLRTMLNFGKFVFNIDGKEFKLNAYIKASEQNPKSIFVPFTDKTCENGKSYSAGRYLDIEFLPDQNTYCIDFNLCYNPYCAYNKKYSCPLVPMDNYLDIEILAGEKIFKKE